MTENNEAHSSVPIATARGLFVVGDDVDDSITHARTLIYPRDLIFMRRSPSGHYISTNIPEPPIAVAAVV